MRWSLRRLLLDGLVVRTMGVIVSGLIVIFELALPWHLITVPPEVRQRGEVASDKPRQLWRRDDVSLDFITQKPLFSASRQPWLPPVPLKVLLKPPPTSPSIDWRVGYKLEGIVVSSISQSALVLLPDGLHTRTLKVNDILNGWRVTEIRTDEVRFIANGVRHELTFQNLTAVMSSGTQNTRMP